MVGRAIAAGLLGLLFMMFVAFDLVLFGVVPLNSVLVTILPAVGLVLGVIFGILAGKRQREFVAVAVTPAAPPPLPPPDVYQNGNPV